MYPKIQVWLVIVSLCRDKIGHVERHGKLHLRTLDVTAERRDSSFDLLFVLHPELGPSVVGIGVIWWGYMEPLWEGRSNDVSFAIQFSGDQVVVAPGDLDVWLERTSGLCE